MFTKRIHISTITAFCIVATFLLHETNALEQTKYDNSSNQKNISTTHTIASTSGSSIPPEYKKDDIYIDDESLEGSGSRGDTNDDLEKEADYSGSGYGPDDEDSSGIRNRMNNKNYGTVKINKNRSKIDEDLESSGDDEIYDDTDKDEDDDDDDDLEIPFGVVTDKEYESEHDFTIEKETETYIKEDKISPDLLPTTDDEDLIPSGKHFNKDILRTNSGKTNKVSGDIDLDTDETGEQSSSSPEQTSDSSDKVKTFGSEVFIMNTKSDDRATSFFAQPGILAAVIGGAVVGLLCAILVVMFIVYRMRKKDEGSYALDEPKRSPAANSYAKNANNREFYA